MKVSQVATLINETTKELIGIENVINEDLSNVVDAGHEIFDNTSYDNFVKALVDHIGRVIFVDRKYTGNTLAIMRDAWEYGAVMEKISAGLPDATENETWGLEDGASYDPNIFTKPDVSAKFYDKRITFEIPLSLADKQVKSAFSSATQLNAFTSMLWGAVDKSMECKLEALASRTVNSFIASTIAHEFPSVSDNDYSHSTGVKAINLLKLYNTQFGLTGTDALTKDNCLFAPEFSRYATLMIDKTMVSRDLHRPIDCILFCFPILRVHRIFIYSPTHSTTNTPNCLWLLRFRFGRVPAHRLNCPPLQMFIVKFRSMTRQRKLTYPMFWVLLSITMHA